MQKISKKRRSKYADIMIRATTMGLMIPEESVYRMMDIESADLVFNLRLNDWLAADDFNFAYDFIGIKHNIERDQGFPAVNFNKFVPRFAGSKLDKLTEKILKEIKELKEREPLEAAANYSYRAGYKRALSAVERIIHFCAEDTTEWIPVEERLPEVGEHVLAQVSGISREGIDFCNTLELASYYQGDGWIIWSELEWKNPNVIAWMPLPDPYKGE